MYHVNILKKWHPPTATLLAVNKNGQTEAEYAESWEEEEAAEWADSNAGVTDDFYPLGDQPAQDIYGCATELPPERRMQLHAVMRQHPDIFQVTPGKTSLMEHVVNVGDCPPGTHRGRW